MTIMRSNIHVYTYVMGQYEFFDNRKVKMVLLPSATRSYPQGFVNQINTL